MPNPGRPISAAGAPPVHDASSTRSIVDDVTRFVLAELAPRRDVTSIEVDDDLLAAGIVDSLGVEMLITFLEERFGVTIAAEEVVPDNFRTPRTVAAFVQQKGG
jgi:acyl carrier protein